jgi:hypothetical protein
MPGNETIAVRKLTNETDFMELVATGKEKYDITVVNLELQDSDDLEPGFGNTVTSHPAYDSLSELETNSQFYTLGQSGNPEFMEMMMDVVAQVRTGFRQVANGVWPVTRGSDNLIEYMYGEVENALLDKPHTKLDETFTSNETGDITDILEGLDWKDTGLGTTEMHETVLRRLVYVWALNWQEKFPKLAQNIVATQSMQTNFDRIIELVTWLIIYEIYYMYIIAYIQSDRAMFNLAFLDYELAKNKTLDDMKTAVDAAWTYFVKRNKIAHVSSMSHYTSWTGDFINDTQIDATTLDNTLDKLRLNYIVPTTSLELARQVFGIGKVQKNSTNFAFLLNGKLPSSSGDYDYHGIGEWAIGLNTALVQPLFKEMKQWNKEIEQAILRNKHYTFSDLKSLLDGYFTEFNFVGSLKGLAEEEVYWGVKRHFAFTDGTVDNALVAEATRDPSDFAASATAPVVDYSNWDGVQLWESIFCQGEISENYALQLPPDITMRHLKFDLLLGLMFDVEESTSWQDHRWFAINHQYVQMVDQKTLEVTDLCYSDREEARWSFMIDHCVSTNFKSIAMEYNVCLILGGVQSLDQTFQEPRPFGWEGKHTMIIDDFTRPEHLRLYAKLLLDKNSSAPPSDVVEQQEPSKPPEPEKATEEDDELT